MPPSNVVTAGRTYLDLITSTVPKAAPEPPKPPKSKRERATENWALLVCDQPAAAPAPAPARVRASARARVVLRAGLARCVGRFLTGVARGGRMELSRSPNSSRKARNSERSAWNACTRCDASTPDGSCLAEHPRLCAGLLRCAGPRGPIAGRCEAVVTRAARLRWAGCLCAGSAKNF
jgi:hypothetical protein